MTNVRQTEEFQRWLWNLRDRAGRGVLIRRIKRFAQGNPGDSRSVGDGVFELRIHFGPGYRVYFVRRQTEITLLLCGGDKGSQQSDIAKAKRLAAGEVQTSEFEDDRI